MMSSLSVAGQDHHPVVLSYGTNVDHFFLRLHTDEAKKTLSDVNKALKAIDTNGETFRMPKRVLPLQPGSQASVLWGDGRLYRCVVIETFDNESYYVRQSDYGEEDVVDGKDLFLLPPSLSGVPHQALSCSLRGWRGGKNQEEQRDKFFNMLSSEKPAFAKFVNPIEGDLGGVRYEVDLVFVVDMLSCLEGKVEREETPQENNGDEPSAETIEQSRSRVSQWLGIPMAASGEGNEELASSSVQAAVAKKTQPNEDKQGKREKKRPEEAKAPDPPLASDLPLRQELSIGEEFVFVFTGQTIRPDSFFVLIDGSAVSEFQKMQERMTEVFPSLRTPPLHELEPDHMILLREYGEEDEVCRAKIISKVKEDSLKVLLVDVGDEIVIDAKKVRALPREFLQLHALAVNCSLAGISPPDGGSAGGYSDGADCLIRGWADSRPKTSALVVEMNGHVCGIEVFGKDMQDCLTTYLDEKKIVVDLWEKDPKAGVDDDDEPSQPEWNPMEDEYRSNMNSYAAKVDNFNQINEEDEHNVRMCKFYRETGNCARGNSCQFVHAFTGKGDTVAGRKINLMTVAHHELKLPDIGTVVLINITCVNSPSSFFVQMPRGAANIEDENAKLQEEEETLEGLVKDMTEYYHAKQFSNQKFSFYGGELVAVMSQKDKRWYRARVLQTLGGGGQDKSLPDDDFGDLEIQYVDYGMFETAWHHNARELEPRFLHLPFQAFECSLVGVDPLDDWWSDKAKLKFIELNRRFEWFVASIKDHTPQATVQMEVFPFDKYPLVSLSSLLLEAKVAKKSVAKKSVWSNEGKAEVRIPG